MSYKVYKHTFPNNKVYIGITGQEVNKRWRNGWGYSHNNYLKNAIKKYGWDNIKHDILFDDLTKDEACQKEIELISLYKSNQKDYGYNLSTGGEHGSTGTKNNNVWNKGKTGVYSQEIKERISKGLKKYYQNNENKSKTKFIKGQVAWNKGKETPLETRKKLSEAHKKLIGDKAPRSRAIIKLSLNGEILEKYVSAKDGALKNNLKATCNSLILRCCKGEVKTAFGYIWKYEEECS